jgi:uncharacterized protein (TIGR03437 family)
MQQINGNRLKHRSRCLGITAAAVAVSCFADNARLSLSAYRALGQPDLRQNGVNIVGSGALNSPQGLAVDSSGHLYVADTFNHRVLGWNDEASFQNGERASIVLGQPNFQQSNPEGIGVKGLAFPAGVGVDPTSGNLFVADVGNNRVVRFPSPFANPTGVEPDAVYGQPTFNTRAPNLGGITNKSMNAPAAVFCDSQGNLWVSDTGNNRVLRFPAAVLNTTAPAADLVLGQANANSGTANRGAAVSDSGFNAPRGLTFDSAGNLYIADFLNARVLQFQAPVTASSVAAVVYGQSKFTTRTVPAVPTSSSLAGPAGVALDASGSLYVAVPGDNRILVFPPNPPSGGGAARVIGQPDFASNTADNGAFPEASSTVLAGVTGLAIDSQGNLLADDAANNRVLFYARNSTTATRVLGQTTFTGNGTNQIKPGSINAAYKIAIDYSQTPFPLYVSDSNNHRVLVWKDAARFVSGAPADLVLGQPNLFTAFPNVDSPGGKTPSSTGLFAPKGIAVAANGDLFVADSGNNRVLRYPRPVDQSGRITPDVVLGQPEFTSSSSAVVSAASFRAPGGLAFGPNGNLFVADTGNHRVLEFANGVSTGATAIRVYGQSSFSAAAAPGTVSAQTLNVPQGLAVDGSYNLYVADAGSHRVLVFPNTSSAPPSGLSASVVLGQTSFATSAAGGGPAGLRSPLDVALDSSGNIFVSDAGNNRVVAFPSLVNLLTSTGPPYSAYLAIGQQNLTAALPNWNTPDGLATPEGLVSPAGLLVDRQDTLYVGDTGNSRVVQFLKKIDFIANGATAQTSAPVGQGAWCALYGGGLATTSEVSKSAALPTSLANRQLMVNDEFLAPLYYVGKGQINFVFPQKAPIGTQRIAARTSDTGELVSGGPVVVAQYAPGLFTNDYSGTGQAAALNADNTRNGPGNPAPRGSVVQLFGTGQGPVASPVGDGQPAPDGPDKTVATPTSDGNTCLASQSYVCVALGGSGGGAVFAEVQYSGLAPLLVGVWQLNVKIPTSGLLGNTLTVRAAIGGTNFSNLVTLAIK